LTPITEPDGRKIGLPDEPPAVCALCWSFCAVGAVATPSKKSVTRLRSPRVIVATGERSFMVMPGKP